MKTVSAIDVSHLCFVQMSAELKVGQYVTSQVEEVKNDGRVVRLSVSHQTISQACAESEQGWNLTNLLPGLLVKATIKKVETIITRFLLFIMNTLIKLMFRYMSEN